MVITLVLSICLVAGHGWSQSASQPDIAALIAALKSTSTGERLDSAEKLGKLGPAAAAAVPALIELLRDHGLESLKLGDETVIGFFTGDAAAQALGRIGKPALAPLADVLREPNVDESRAFHAANALGTMNLPEATQLLLKLSGDTSYAMRSIAMRGLGRSQDPRALPALLGFIASADEKVREAAAQGLDGRREPEAVAALIKTLGDPEAPVRAVAALGLMHSANPAALEALINALKDADPKVRNFASQGLGALKDVRGVPALIDVVSGDKESLVRFQAARALEAITGQKFGEDGARWRKWWQGRKDQR